MPGSAKREGLPGAGWLRLLLVVLLSAETCFAQTDIEKAREAARARENQLLSALKLSKQFGKEDPRVAEAAVNLANFYYALRDYEESERFYKQALKIRERNANDDLKTADVLYSLGVLHFTRAWLFTTLEAEGRGWAIVSGLNNDVLRTGMRWPRMDVQHSEHSADARRHFIRAQGYFLRCLQIREKLLPAQDFDVLATRLDLGRSYLGSRKWDEAGEQFHAAVKAIEQNLGAEHEYLATALTGLGQAHAARKDPQAVEVFRRALAIGEKRWGADDPRLCATLLPFASMLRRQDQESEAAELETRARLIVEKAQATRTK